MAAPENCSTPDPANRDRIITELQRERLKFSGAAQLAPLTQSGYRADAAIFERWSGQMGFEPLPTTGEILSLYVTSLLLRGLKVSTAARRVSGIAHTNRERGYGSPVTEEVRSLLNGARRLKAEQPDQVLPLTAEELRGVSLALIADDTPISIRNWAMILTGFCGALRNSSTAALLVSDVTFCEQGAELRIRRSKTDQKGVGRTIGLHHSKLHPETCPVNALRKWIERRGSAVDGPLFSRFGRGLKERPLRPERIGQIVQECIERTGRDSKLYGGHSLRRGFVTEAGQTGASELLIAAVTGHRSMAILRTYFQRRDAFAGNALGGVDL
jgi:site-specific recombinase XerD